MIFIATLYSMNGMNTGLLRKDAVGELKLNLSISLRIMTFLQSSVQKLK